MINRIILMEKNILSKALTQISIDLYLMTGNTLLIDKKLLIFTTDSEYSV